jgi:hypothetical protein
MDPLTAEDEAAFRRYATVARWIKSTTDSQVVPRHDWARRLACLKRFCDHLGTDPDRMTKVAISDAMAKNAYLREMKAWVAGQTCLTDRERHEVENMLRHYFMKQGFRMMTKPFADVYNRNVSP